MFRCYVHAEAAMKELKSTKSVADVNVDTYDAIYVPGKLYIPTDTSHKWNDSFSELRQSCWHALAPVVATMVKPGDAWHRRTWHCD